MKRWFQTKEIKALKSSWELDHEAPPASSMASLFSALIWRRANINGEVDDGIALQSWDRDDDDAFSIVVGEFFSLRALIIWKNQLVKSKSPKSGPYEQLKMK